MGHLPALVALAMIPMILHRRAQLFAHLIVCCLCCRRFVGNLLDHL